MKYTLLGTLAAVAAAAALSAFGFAPTAAAQDDKQPTHAELVQRWAEAAIEAQLKGMKTSLRLSADQEKLWGAFESAVKDGQNARLLDLQKEQSDNLSPMDRLTAKADRLTRSRANLEKIVEAAKPLYASLGDEQKHKFITLGRMLVPERGSFVKEMRRLEGRAISTTRSSGKRYEDRVSVDRRVHRPASGASPSCSTTTGVPIGTWL